MITSREDPLWTGSHLLFALLTACVGSSPAPDADAVRRPNILFILADDQRFDTVRALGNDEVRTPALDGLVRRGFTFTNAYCQGSMVPAVCLPSRTMLLTGRSLFRIPQRNDPPGNRPLLPQVLADAGYDTFHYGKRGNTYVPASEAFQKVLYSDEKLGGRAEQSRLHADGVIDYLRHRKSDRPFFVYLAPPVPHDPRVAPKEFTDLYDPGKLTLSKNYLPQHPFDNGELKVRDELLAPHPRTPEEMRRHLADYYAAITCLDHHVGRVLGHLKETKQLDHTVVVYSSDQGLAVGGRHGLMGKQNLYEHFKSPLIVAGTGVPHGQSDALVYLYDLFPTLCDVAGVSAPKEAEGTSLLPVLRREKAKVRDRLFAAYRDVQRMARDDRWKLLWYPKIDRYQLFDLTNDPWELDDLSGKPGHAARVAELKKRLAEEQERFGDNQAPRPR